MFRFSRPGFVAPTIALSALLALSAAASVSVVERYEDESGSARHYLEIAVEQNDLPASVFLIVGQEQIDVDLGLFRLKVEPQLLLFAGRVEPFASVPLEVPLPPDPLPGFYVQAIVVYDDAQFEWTEALELSDAPFSRLITVKETDPAGQILKK